MGAEDAEDEADRLEREADTLRAKLTTLVKELDRRRHEAASHLLKPMAVAVAVALVGLAARAWLRARAARRRRTWWRRAEAA